MVEIRLYILQVARTKFDALNKSFGLTRIISEILRWTITQFFASKLEPKEKYFTVYNVKHLIKPLDSKLVIKRRFATGQVAMQSDVRSAKASTAIQKQAIFGAEIRRFWTFTSKLALHYWCSSYSTVLRLKHDVQLFFGLRGFDRWVKYYFINALKLAPLPTASADRQKLTDATTWTTCFILLQPASPIRRVRKWPVRVRAPQWNRIRMPLPLR